MGELKGRQIQPRDLARSMYATVTWQDAFDLVTALAICLAESQGYEEAFNDNVVPAGETRKGLDGRVYTEGQTWQRDCGVMQIGIAGSLIGTDEEFKLYKYGYNIQRGADLYENGGWRHWMAWINKVYLRDSYLKRAVRGVGNFLAEQMLTMPTDTLHDGEMYLHKLENPVLDYYYRVDGMADEARIGLGLLRNLKKNLTTDANKARADEVAHSFSKIILWVST